MLFPVFLKIASCLSGPKFSPGDCWQMGEVYPPIASEKVQGHPVKAPRCEVQPSREEGGGIGL